MIAGLAVSVGIEYSLGPLATAYVLILVVLGPLTARYTEPVATWLTGRRHNSTAVSPAVAHSGGAEKAPSETASWTAHRDAGHRSGEHTTSRRDFPGTGSTRRIRRAP